LGRTSPEGLGPGHGFLLPLDGGDFLRDLVDLHYVVLVLRPVLADWGTRFVHGTVNGHDDFFLRRAIEHGGGVGDLLVHIESNVDRLDVWLGGEPGL
jgi:hypothetical protein